MNKLEIKKIKKTWNKNTPHEVFALRDTSISIDEGEFIVIVGSNASGKSTFLNLLSGEINPDNGNIYIDEKEITDDPEYKRSLFISKVKQDPNQSLIPGLTVVENFALALKRGLSKKLRLAVNNDVRKKAIELLEPLGLGIEKRLDSNISLFSGGQRQAIALVCATLNNPKLLLLDEHTAALDPVTSEKILKITDKIVRKNKITTIMITHNITHALTYGDRLVVMEAGKIKFDIKGEEKKKITVSEIVEKIEGKEILEEVL